MNDRIILHSDLNCFYASVETVLDPSLEGKAVAVCGSTEERHGIVLAKSERAKRMGVKTGMTNCEARCLCPELIIVPPHFEKYVEFSSLVRNIYYEYTDLVEPYGLDECWLDVTGSRRLFGSGEEIANALRQQIKSRLGLTVSVGVSFCKSFAKLGSDMKKPDAVTVLSRENYAERIRPLPAGDLIFVGRATCKKLSMYGIHTLGDIARLKREVMVELLGVRGGYIWDCISGRDSSPVIHKDYRFPVKSVGHGITCTADLVSVREVGQVFLELTREIGHKLRGHKMLAKGVSISVKNSSLGVRMHQCTLNEPTRNPLEIARAARELFLSNYGSHFSPIRALTVTAINLCDGNTFCQTDLFSDFCRSDRNDRLADTLDDINIRFGDRKIFPLSLKEIKKLPEGSSHETTLPGNYIR